MTSEADLEGYLLASKPPLTTATKPSENAFAADFAEFQSENAPITELYAPIFPFSEGAPLPVAAITFALTWGKITIDFEETEKAVLNTFPEA